MIDTFFTADNFARVLILAMASGLLLLCVYVFRRSRSMWRISVANGLWAVSLMGWTLTSLLVMPRPVETLNWWARISIIYSIIMVGLMTWLLYVIITNGSNGGGEK